MTATTFDPTAIAITPAARTHIAAQISRSGHRYLRLGVKESGCNGFMYTLDFIDGPDPEDRRFEFDDIDVFVSDEALPLVLGTEIDYAVEGLNASLKFKNPRAASYCGCGESFSIKPD
ncbi:MAG: iron-sulfur cluster assembly accessory protein [Pseudomonadales bacterium]|jgi:iron-sulfur cluster assembly accessory protein